MYRSTGPIFLFILAVILAGCSTSLAGDITPPPGSVLSAPQETAQPATENPVYPILPASLDNGKLLYDQECTQCHGKLGLGDGPQAAQLSVSVAGLGLSDFARQFSPADWYKVVSQGNMEKFMPAFPDLTDRERWDVVAYAMSLSISSDTISQGQALYNDNCANCHGTTGNGNGPDASGLTGQPTSFIDQAFMAQNSSASIYQAISAGVSPDMPSFSARLDDNQRWALAGYLRSMTYIPLSTANKNYPAPAGTAQLTTLSYPGPAAYPEPVVTQNPGQPSATQTTPQATFIGTVTVQLINGTGGDPPSDTPVTLYGFDNMQNTYSETLTTGENGVYTFTNVTMPAGRVFLAGTEYASGTYGSSMVTVDPSTPDLPLQITVYDTTTDISMLTTDRVHIFFDFTDPQNVQVIEVFIISNPGKQAVVSPAADGTVVSFPLPRGFTNLQFDNGALGDRYVETSQGFADTMTVTPGEGQYQVVFAFNLPYDHKLSFSQPMFLPTNAVVVMVPDNGVKVDSSTLQDGGTSDLQNTTYRLYDGSSLLAGSSLEFTLTGTPKKALTSILSTGGEQNLAIGLGVFGVALVIAGMWLYQRNRSRLATQGASVSRSGYIPDTDFTPEDENTLIDAIIALDDQYHAGNLPEDAYLERRAALKEKLKQMNQG